MLAVLRVRQFTPFQKLNFTVEHVLKCLVESNVIGKGCSRVVYRAEMPNQEVIAVKKLWPVTSTVTKTSGVPDSFSAEFKTLGSIRHKNIVRFLGCCWNKNTRLLMYDYMSNGNLESLLHERSGECSLGWEVRYRIILVEAQGLAYLHHDCVPPIVHRDIKANNILIGPDLEPYIGDFVLAKLVDDGDFARSSKNIAGSYGYITPVPEDRPTMRDVAAMLSEIRQEREESTKGVENNGCSGSCNNNGGERIYDSSPSSAVQQTAKYLRNSSKSFSASVFDVLFFLLLLVMLEQM
ncbi:LRR receptor-like serine/threonine-protein kinase RGI2 [Brassica napus]|uniref:LRR receptor-like serine/threonine-protein kinase RGI2 n=1 Tax=Brassica napus TaxID=3708 RepID=UPI00207A72E1|nr:LRR receptor-like serine/threonine-protein kinase RGI2 [Brassica napus]